ncbi:hypothetical protein [Mesorhizobium sp. M0768]|uniref:hypothetical protein n=1 Tax=Mesorhizobium sp. M0768 TaxID=2956996 RepID=UPI003337F146
MDKRAEGDAEKLARGEFELRAERYGVNAFLLVVELVNLLEKRGTISSDDVAKITEAAALAVAASSEPDVNSINLLQAIAAARLGLYQIRQQSAPTEAWTTEIKGTDAEGKRVEDNA